MSQVHPQARTTPRTSGKIACIDASVSVLAERYKPL